MTEKISNITGVNVIGSGYLSATVVRAFDIPDAWYKCVRTVLTHGREWTIQKGSYEGHKRREFDSIFITISNPGNKPLVPDVPVGVPPPTSEKAINDYMAILVSPEKGDYEYSYGERIFPQLAPAIDMLKKTPMTNQATIEVGRPEDFGTKNPPCLRLIDLRVQPAYKGSQLHFFVYFRSWDLWSGFPPNLAGLQKLKEYMAGEIGVDDGTLNAWSKGLHLYDFQFEYAKKLTEPQSMGRRVNLGE